MARTKTIAAIIGASGVVFVGYLAMSWWTRLDRSLEALMRETFRLEYTVRSRYVDRSVDSEGRWLLSLPDGSSKRIAAVLASQFGRSRDEEQYFKDRFREKLLIGGSLDGYALFEADIALGARSMCPNLPCEIEILFDEGKDELFVGISKL